MLAAHTLDFFNQVGKCAALIVLEVMRRHSVLALLPLVLLCLQGQIQIREQVGILCRICQRFRCLGVDLGQLFAPQLDHLKHQKAESAAVGNRSKCCAGSTKDSTASNGSMRHNCTNTISSKG